MIEARFDLPPREAMEFFRAKGFATGFAWQDVWQQEHDAAFTVAKMMDVDLLRDVRSAVDKALADGQTFQQFREGIEGRLMEAGWWGRAEMVDPANGEKRLVELGSPRRLRTVFNVNMQSAYAAGAWQQSQATKASAPFLMYDAVDDEATREEHARWDGTVLPMDDAWWQQHTPPNGWNCRCSVVQLSAAQVRELGLEVAEKAPASKEREYTNPRTGEVSMVPEGVDPGWAYSPGASRAGRAVTQLANKAAEAPPEIGAAAMKALSPAEAQAFDAEHAAWIDEVMKAERWSGWRVVGGLAVEDLMFCAARGIEPKSAAISLESRLLRGPKAERHERAGDALGVAEWRALSAGLREPQAVLFHKASGKLHFVLRGSGDRSSRLVVQLDYHDRGRSLNSVRSGFRLSVQALRDATAFELIRGAL